ncbi:unnamed protein product [Ectocarpus sp. 6 AP-2014]
MERVRAVLSIVKYKIYCCRSFFSVFLFFCFFWSSFFLLPLGELSPAVYCSHLCDLSST